eukprot:TRINITY_DN19260_c0_g1_i3.p1 TRINITY_DN19260_c0_g1~~TRINITY_DN19260_c0_g1_i3.p1  ORF type:complete len:470 (+),score=69.49 TRINITY_DN19260_c0_g1_i3:166-1575(+)
MCIRDRREQFDWLLGPSYPALGRWTVLVLIFMVSYDWFFSKGVLTMCADMCQGAIGTMAGLALFPSPAAGRWSSPVALETHSAAQPLTIEKIIHQTYKTRDNLPAAWNATPAVWQQMHPGWKYMFWTDVTMREFVSKEYPWFLGTFDSYEFPIQRADAIRYLAIHHYGGMYADMDLQPLQSIEPYLRGADVVAFETPNLGLTNMILAGRKNSPFFKCTIAQLMGRQKMWHFKLAPYKGWKILSSSGPAFWWAMGSSAICGKHFEAEASNQESLRLLAPSFMGRCSLCKGDVSLCQKHGVLKHLVGNSWHAHAKKNTGISHFIFLCQPGVAACLIGGFLKIILTALEFYLSCSKERVPLSSRLGQGVPLLDIGVRDSHKKDDDETRQLALEDPGEAGVTRRVSTKSEPSSPSTISEQSSPELGPIRGAGHRQARAGTERTQVKAELQNQAFRFLILVVLCSLLMARGIGN